MIGSSSAAEKSCPLIAFRECTLPLKGTAFLLSALLALLVAARPLIKEASAAVLRVPGSYPSIQDALNKAGNGDTILVSPGRYTLFFTGIIIPENSDVILKSTNGPLFTTISGRGNIPVITIREGSSAVVEGFTIVRQGSLESSTTGGGIYCGVGSRPVIKHNILIDNQAVLGGGIYCDVKSEPAILENLFKGNRAHVAGGAIFADHARGLIARNRFLENSAGSSGGAIACNRDFSKISNNIFWKNRAVFGGSISCDRAASMIENNTHVENKASFGGAVFVERGSVRITNLILWHNIPDGLALTGIGPAARPAFCDVQKAIFRGINGNISKDPLFAGPEAGNFHLLPGSPCIDKGSPDPFYYDHDGSFNDMGAYGGSQPLVDSRLPHYKEKR